VNDEPGQPVHGVECLAALAVLGYVDDLGGTVRGVRRGDVNHALPGETGADDVSSQILKAFFIIGPNRLAR
jgi:hypothetical protein